MSVYKRTKDSPYYDYDFAFRGDRFCGSCETANRRAAEKVEEGRRAEVKAEYECRKRAAGTVLTVDGAFLRYWEEVGKYHKRSDQTMWSLKWLLESLGKDKRIRDITNNDVAHLVARRRGVAAALGRRRGNHHVKPPKLVSPARVNRSVTEPLRKSAVARGGERRCCVGRGYPWYAWNAENACPKPSSGARADVICGLGSARDEQPRQRRRKLLNVG